MSQVPDPTRPIVAQNLLDYYPLFPLTRKIDDGAATVSGTQWLVVASLAFPTIFETATSISISTSLLLTLLFKLSTFRLPHSLSNLAGEAFLKPQFPQITAVLAPHLSPPAKFLSFSIVSGSILHFIKWFFFSFSFYTFPSC